MVVHVRLFAMLRERAGSSRIELELPDGACVADALAALDHLGAGTALVMAVNREYAREDAALAPGDELALIPPVSGGSDVHVAVTERALSVDRLHAAVSDPLAGAIVTFSGVTREVDALHYEAYAEMAHEQMAGIVADAVRRHRCCRGAAEHRVGRVALSQPSVIVAVSGPHREQAFGAAREIIDEIKARAPVWKKEIEKEGAARWVAGRPPVR